MHLQARGSGPLITIPWSTLHDPVSPSGLLPGLSFPLFLFLCVPLVGLPVAGLSGSFVTSTGFVLDRPLRIQGVDILSNLNELFNQLTTLQIEVAGLKATNAALQANLTEAQATIQAIV